MDSKKEKDEKKDMASEDVLEQGEQAEQSSGEDNESPGQSDSSGQNPEVVKLQQEISKLNDTILRDRAEFQNYRKRTSQEALLSEGRTAGKILQEIMPAFDAFDQLLSSSGSGSLDTLLKGAELIKKQLWQAFENLGVEEINPVETDFDPLVMEALSVEESEEVTTEKVIQVYQKGYRYKERVLRPARVGVKKPKLQEKKENQ